MKFVYLIRSITFPSQTYVGLTEDFDRRLIEHNTGKSRHASDFRPWRPVVVIRFEDDRRAAEFEVYLKSGSGHAFAKKRLW